tara:strand:- start:300 stop:833 length:534 start_codon:yes stop_codon:yes gene_type:complete
MNNYFKVFDNFCNPIELNNFYKEYCLSGKISWKYNNNSGDYPVDAFCTSMAQEDLLSIPFLSQTKIKIQNLVSIFNNEFRRIIFNGQPNGFDGTIHCDYEKPGSLTALLFVNPEWEKWWGGDFLLYDKEGEELINGVTFKSNRLVLFDANLHHRGLGPIHTALGTFRVSIAFQFEKT